MILIRASLETQQYWLALVAAAVGLLTVYSMTKIWAEVFWKPAPQGTQTVQAPRFPSPSAWMLAPVAVLTGLTLVIGLGAEFVFQFAAQAAEDIANPALYVNSVLGDQK
jgi:multicomponent Na+:H+ antiporter subunit D